MTHGADINAEDEDGNTPLHQAESENASDTVKLLVEHGADINEGNVDKTDCSIPEAEKDVRPTEAVENDSEVDEREAETSQTSEPARANAKVSEFWQPIRDGEFGGLFTGKPVPVSNEGWITKTIRNIGVCLYVTNQRCYVQIYFYGANESERSERREKVMPLFPKSEYTYVYRDSPRETKVQFPVLDKGKNDREDWDEIREKLIAMGTDIYNKIDESGL